MKQIVLLGLAFVWALSACGGGNPADRAKKVASVEHLRTYTEAIAHDSCEGRRPFSVGADRAVGYIAEQMKAVGLQPVSGESYFQPNIDAALERAVALRDELAENQQA